MLEEICRSADEVVIGIGSPNKYNQRNPFTYDETREMIDNHLKREFDNYTIVPVEDFAHLPEYRDGKRWAENVKDRFGDLDAFVTGNPYTAQLLSQYYPIIRSFDLVPEDRWIKVSGTMVRVSMASNNGWRELVPEDVARYITEKKLDERFREEFGLATLANLADEGLMIPEDHEKEKIHTYEA